jgi:Flp pilus assembly protein TadD
MAVQLDGAEPRYRNNLCMAQAGSGYEDQAYRTCKSTMKNADAAYMVGLSLERFGDNEAAERWYHKALDIDPKHLETQLRLDGLTEVGEPWQPPVPDTTVPAPAPSGEVQDAQ